MKGVTYNTIISLGYSEYNFDRLLLFLKNNINELHLPVLLQCNYNQQIFLETPGVTHEKHIEKSLFNTYLENSKLIISHCGVGSIEQFGKYNCKKLFFARNSKYQEHLDDHQIELLDYLVKAFPDLKNLFQKDFNLKLLNSDLIKVRYKILKDQIVFKDNRINQIISVSSVGGHFYDAVYHTNRFKTTYILDEKFRVGENIILFKSCNKRYKIPLRIIQAYFFIIKNKKIFIEKYFFTSGAAVGFVFFVALKLHGFNSNLFYVKDSATRIGKNSKWFIWLYNLYPKMNFFSYSQSLLNSNRNIRELKYDIKILY